MKRDVPWKVCFIVDKMGHPFGVSNRNPSGMYFDPKQAVRFARAYVKRETERLEYFTNSGRHGEWATRTIEEGKLIYPLSVREYRLDLDNFETFEV